MKDKFLRSLLTKIPSSAKTFLLCGHYALFPEGDKLVPGIYQDVNDSKLREWLKMHPYSSEFPLESFRFGIELEKRIRGNTRLVSLVNDWQHVPKNNSGISENIWRTEYYKTAHLPTIYDRMLQEEGISSPIDAYAEVPLEDRYYCNSLHFSETCLRNKYKTSYKSTCSLEHGCAQEFLPFLHALERMKCTHLVAVIPGTCTVPTLASIKEAREVLGLKIKIWTIYIYNPASLDDFWNGAIMYEDGEYELAHY